MTHAESAHLGCVCPECGARCDACLGTDTVLSKDQLKSLAQKPWSFDEHFNESVEASENEPEDI
jgi:hypothetical protein